jgi:cell division protein FtsL
MSPAGRPGAVLAAPRPQGAPAPRPDRLRLVLDDRTIRRRRRWAVLITGAALAAVFSVLLGLAAFQTLLAQGQSRLDRLDAATRDAAEANEKLRYQVAQLESPDRVRAEAEARLGMVPADETRYVMPDAGDAAEVAQAADDER